MKSYKITRLLYSIFLLMLITSNHAFAQKKISGKVISEQTAEPADGATITIKNKNRAVSTNEAGRFTIEASEGDVLIVTMIGY